MSVLRIGKIVATPGALELMDVAGVDPLDLLRRHARGDWGIVCDEDKVSNDRAVEDGERVLSAYAIGTDKVWIITEADRSVTTFLLPEDY